MPQEQQNSESDLNQDRPKPFLQHLEELRWTILWSLAVLIVAMLACLPLAPLVFRWLCAPLSQITACPETFLRSLEITGAFSIVLQLVFWGGLILSAPVILFLAGGFVFPGLTARERKLVRVAGVFAFFSLHSRRGARLFHYPADCLENIFQSSWLDGHSGRMDGPELYYLFHAVAAALRPGV